MDINLEEAFSRIAQLEVQLAERTRERREAELAREKALDKAAEYRAWLKIPIDAANYQLLERAEKAEAALAQAQTERDEALSRLGALQPSMDYAKLAAYMKRMGLYDQAMQDAGTQK